MKIGSMLLGCLASLSLLSAGAHAASFNIEPFPNPFSPPAGTIVEDFEGAPVGPWDPLTDTNVGRFSPLDPSGTGSGSTCTTLGGDCTELFLSDTDVNGQGNITPEFGIKALQANDTFGMIWDVFTPDGRAFTDIFFGIRDAADQGATFTVTLDEVNGAAPSMLVQSVLTGQPNSGELLFSLALADIGLSSATSARISLVSSKVNDSFTFDGGALTPVPVPAALPLFLSALAGFGFISRRRRKS